MKHFLIYTPVVLACSLLFTFETLSSRVLRHEIVNPVGNTIESRFNAPASFQRVVVKKGTFGEYLRNLPLQEQGSKVHLYNGREKIADVHEAVLKMDVGTADLQQCADACIRLRSEYLYKEKRYSDIHFNFTNGWRADYSKWMEGYRIVVNGNHCTWEKKTAPDNSYPTFRKYLDKVFSFAGTLSLSKELRQENSKDLKGGDIFIVGGSPGHAVIVVDVAFNPKNGKKLFMLAQSYMPAQEIHVLKNPGNSRISPWYEVEEAQDLITPEWTFPKGSLKSF